MLVLHVGPSASDLQGRASFELDGGIDVFVALMFTLVLDVWTAWCYILI